MRGNIAEGAIALLIFTLPGVLIVSGLFERLRARGAIVATAYLISIGAGMLIGGVTLAVIFRTPLFALPGGLFGLTTSLCWAILHRLSFPAHAQT